MKKEDKNDPLAGINLDDSSGSDIEVDQALVEKVLKKADGKGGEKSDSDEGDIAVDQAEVNKILYGDDEDSDNDKPAKKEEPKPTPIAQTPQTIKPEQPIIEKAASPIKSDPKPSQIDNLPISSVTILPKKVETKSAPNSTIIQPSVSPKQIVQTDPFIVVDRYETKTKLENHQKLILHLDDNKKFAKLDANRMNYSYKQKIGLALAKPENEKLLGLPTCMTSQGGIISIANSQGIIRLFDYREGERKSLIHKDLQGLEITCIDIHPTEPQIVVGTKKSIIAIWDLKTCSVLKSFATGKGFGIINVKFLKGPRQCIIWSDAGGDVIVSEYSKAFIGYNITNIAIMREAYAFSLNPLFPNELYPSKLDNFSLIAIAGFASIYILNIDTPISLLWEYRRKDAAKHTLPYIDWGRGALPNDPENQNLILAIAWDKIIQLIEIKEPFQKEDGYGFSGYYESQYEIIGMYWVSESVLCVVNNMKEVRVLYTGNFNSGRYPEPGLNIKKQVTDKKLSEELEKPYKSTEEFIPQVVKLGKDQTVLKNTYHQTIIRKGHQVLGLTKIGPFEAKLYTWNEFLEEQRGKSKWINALSVSIEVYQGVLKGFANVPERKDLREETLKANMKEFLCDSLMQDLEKMQENAAKSPTDGVASMTQIQVTIEYCLIISSYDLLFRTIYELYADAEMENLFIQAMEPFILAGKFCSIPIPGKIFDKMLDYYVKVNKTRVLEQILLALPLEGFDLTKLSDICTNNKLFSAFIYIKTLENNETQFIEPLIYMGIEMRLKRKDKTILKLDAIRSIPEQAEVSAIYLGYKILWYIDLCFKGKKYPPGKATQITIEAWPKVVYGIINWLFLEQNETTNLYELMKQDLNQVLIVFKELFENETTRGFLKEPEKYKSKDGYGFDYIAVLDKIMNTTKGLQEDVPRNMTLVYRFMAKIASIQGIHISADWCIETVKSLKENLDENFTKKVSEETIVGILKNQVSKLSKENINSLISYFLKSEYTEVVIYLWEINGEYTKCFDAFLDAKDLNTSLKIFTWLKHIKELLGDVNSVNNDDIKLLKSAIYDRLERLVALNMDSTEEVVDKWFANQHEEVIEKLKKEPTLQLEYVLRVLSEKEQDISQIFKEFSVSGKETDEYKRYTRILTLNVELLCDLRPNKVMENIEKKWYPTQLCLDICRKKDHKEAIAFLLKRSGAFAESLNAYIEILNKYFKLMLEDTTNDIIGKNDIEFRRFFESALKVCKKNAKVTGNSESEQGLWFQLLDSLYEMWLSLVKLKNEKPMTKESITKNNSISNSIKACIKMLVVSMMECVSFPTILKQITEKHGELEISSFKEMFASTLTSYFYQEKILETARGIIGNGVVKQFDELTKLKSKGVFLKHTYCSKCGNNILHNNEAEAIAFPCGHIYHSNCLRNREGCYVCMYGEKSIFPIKMPKNRICVFGSIIEKTSRNS